MEGIGGQNWEEPTNPEGLNPFEKQNTSPEKQVGGDMLVDSLDAAIEAVRMNPNSTASTMPILEWDTVELQPLDPARGIFIIKIKGFPEPVGATSDKEGFLSRFQKAG